MLVVTVEVWPGGNLARRTVVGRMELANVSQLAAVSDYEGHVTDYGAHRVTSAQRVDIRVEGHVRADGVWELVEKALRARSNGGNQTD